ncbi:hypothetical protein [Enterococcus ureasiticus]|uniref:Ethanolamine utilization protein n=1 Tax=Enterococcus ureasiticus TaxID=903984 RepID=A0A1E5GME3_9ENTE|nr:hypothetical protein [Enterococcus ureasiticus]OEG13873.1 hypothetical protein BCR21_02460 [Enterococcus ureasiticus]
MKTTDFDKLVEKITEKVMERLTEIERNSTRSHCLFGANKNWLTCEYIYYLHKISRNKLSDVVVITEISFENLVNTLNFNPQNDLEETIVKTIKEGKEFVIIKDGRTYLSLLTAGRYALKKTILDFENQLYRYGGIFISLAELKQNVSDSKKIPPYEALKNKNYLTVKDLSDNTNGLQNTVELSDQTIITDYAKEYIREKKINISWTNEK